MNIYDIKSIETEIEKIASENDGEIPEQLIEKLVIANTGNLQQIEKLCKYIKHLEHLEDAASNEIQRITKIKKVANNRRENIKKYLTPYVDNKGKISSGMFTLSTRKSHETEITDNNLIPNEFKNTTITTTINKLEIRRRLLAGENVPGAKLNSNKSLVIS